MEREQGEAFMPRFDGQGLLAAMAVDADDSSPLMLAWMNAEALALTQETGVAHFWSRSRQALWKKGETSGHVLEVIEILVDCDQDALVLRCRPAGPACHTGARNCFYRRLEQGRLVRVVT
ncbi:MAG: phosphoribosyl-AMP cyclohydrolase [Erythrobacter sp. 34-65-8]|nr:MAG: phosphoribosyl-AMP cyclohydrolase [Erythrobacter sp. 34-65-8]